MPSLSPLSPTQQVPADSSSRAAIVAAPALVIRRLAISDSLAYRTFRLRGLYEYPDAFTSGFEEENARPAVYTDKRLDPSGSERLWGAFQGMLIGRVTGHAPLTVFDLVR